MAKSASTKPYVYIIESLELQDEEDGHFEGEVISKILNFSEIEHKYRYIRTKSELEHFLEEFKKLRYRYLHISCHGTKDAIYTTLDKIRFDELALMVGDKLDKKRLFLSSCLSTNKDLAKNIFPVSECYSIIGPNKSINMDDAAIFWASFYQLIFKQSLRRMKHYRIEDLLKNLKELHQVPLKYYSSSASTQKGWREVEI